MTAYLLHQSLSSYCKPAQPQRRLIEQHAQFILMKNLSGPLTFGQLNYLALPYENYKLALSMNY
jgi:hypothetical protein